MISFKKKEMIPLANKEIKSCEKQKVCYICKFCDDKNKKVNMTFIIVITPENLEEPLIILAI